MNKQKFEALMGLVFEVKSRTKNKVEVKISLGNSVTLEIWDITRGCWLEDIVLDLDYKLLDNDYNFAVITFRRMLKESEVLA